MAAVEFVDLVILVAVVEGLFLLFDLFPPFVFFFFSVVFLGGMIWRILVLLRLFHDLLEFSYIHAMLHLNWSRLFVTLLVLNV